MSFIKWIIALPLIVGAVLFALAHPQTVSLTWSPFNPPTELPLYAVALLFLGIGLLIGMVMAWLGMHKTRSERRQYKKELKTKEKELEESNQKLLEYLSKKETHISTPQNVIAHQTNESEY